MFIVPEILWSPVVNFYYEFFQSSRTSNVHPIRDNFLQNSDNLSYLKFVIALQFIGLLLALIFLVKNKYCRKKIIKYLLIALLSVTLIITGFALYSAMTLSMEIF
ncbi:MAG: hypothetical protein A2599_01095 [Candidatus Staskawiczbacteria bacterium RIFOXYD1_FULL_39_28]|nr:MAG: hypothetical protein A2599_01095 [Candidatus Staskawiczbacteria bacterium RIFOXYD1_FULL_39_28]